MQPDDSDLQRFQRYRNLDGSASKASRAKRNGRLYLSISPHGWDQEDPTERPERHEISKYYVNLNPLERKTWSSILRGLTISDIARDERVSRQAILCRIRGNGRGEGGMIAKNFWVLIWWMCRHAINSRNRNV